MAKQKTCLFDTNVLSLFFCINEKEMINHNLSVELVNKLKKDSVRIYIPSIVVFEILLACKTEIAKNNLLANIQKRFMIVEFGTRAAFEGSILIGDGTLKDYKQAINPDTARNVIKTDMLIVATAKQRGIDCIYTMDSDIIRIAQKSAIVAINPLQTNKYATRTSSTAIVGVIKKMTAIIPGSRSYKGVTK